MIALISGVILITFTVFAIVPAGLDWSADILLFLRGCIPVVTALIGVITVFVGIADIKDKKEAKKEEAAALSQVEEKK